MVGLGLGDLLRGKSLATPARPAPARSVVFIFQSGGPSQHETLDPKPLAPQGVRGEYGVTATRLPGIQFCEFLPRLATRADRFSVIRTLRHTADRQFRNEHNSGMYLLLTGSTELPVGDTNATITNPRPGRMEWPSIGSQIAFALAGDRSGGWPAVVEIPRENLMKYPGRGPGLLGPRFDRWGVDLAPRCQAPDAAGSCPNCFSHDDPNDPARAAGPGPNAWWNNSSCRDAGFHLPALVQGGFSPGELSRRTELLGQLDTFRRTVERQAEAGLPRQWDAHREQALQLLIAARPGKANPFDLAQEPDRVRDRYGREEWGQGFLVARRLVEAGVKLVQINLRGWDTHQNAFRDLEGKLLPSLDHCLSGFLDDLDERGLLQETLVVMCGEMGRTPRISPIAAGGKNASGELFTDGRHHWGDVFPCLLAGGGIEPGRVLGQTDPHGGQPVGDAWTPSDLAATILDRLGVDPATEFHDATGRPHRLFQGNPIPGLW
ncbi:MAG: DUF1501 domain-containing protein [Planctomycetaceae bacterium]